MRITKKTNEKSAAASRKKSIRGINNKLCNSYTKNTKMINEIALYSAMDFLKNNESIEAQHHYIPEMEHSHLSKNEHF